MTDDVRFQTRLTEIGNAVDSLARNQQKNDIQRKIEERAHALDQAITANEQYVTTATSQLTAAHDSGDSAAIATAQLRLTEAVSARDGAKRDRTDYEARLRAFERKAKEPPKEKEGKIKADAEPVDDTNLRDWTKKQAAWYGVDKEMTKAAQDIGKDIETVGVIDTGTPEYFEAIDRQMAAKYPDKFDSVPETGSGGGASGSTRSNAGRIPASIIAGWERMGINTKDPAVLERMVGHRDTLVQKNILPVDMVKDPVVTR